MLIAKVNGERCHATKGAKGVCPFCGAEVIAKCGEQKRPHWAHKSRKECDSWHDKETEWHLMWKNYFPIEWQEIIKYDEQTGEKHIADVCTPQGFTLEFQHSHIKPEERRSREAFYKNMNWVVDCTRLHNDYKRFVKNFPKNNSIRHQDDRFGVYTLIVRNPDEVFPKEWINCSVPVVFDFKGLESTGSNDLRNLIYCLLPKQFSNTACVVAVSHGTFIENAKRLGWMDYIKRTQDTWDQVIQTNNLYFVTRF